MIGEAKSAGADYVQTPEMTNIMDVQRERFFASDRRKKTPTPRSPLSANWRASSRFIVHVGSLAIKVAPEKAANRGFLIDPKGDIVARYDKIHMFDVDLAGGESYRESRNYRAGRDRRRCRPAVGPCSA